MNSGSNEFTNILPKFKYLLLFQFRLKILVKLGCGKNINSNYLQIFILSHLTDDVRDGFDGGDGVLETELTEP